MSAEKNIVVSVCMLAYNHELYIEEALQSIINQRVNFNFEILVHDDASTDGTALIIKKYADLYPDIVKPIIQQKNFWSQGVNPSVFFNYPRASGKYVAWCEGDDCWTDLGKLQDQVDVLNSMPTIDICFHRALQENCTGNIISYVIGNYAEKSGIISFDDVFLRRYGMIPTASCLVRKKVMDQLQEFMQARPYLTSGDIYMQALGAFRGGAYFINKVMSKYRFGTESSLTLGILKNNKKFANHHLSCIRGMISLWKNYFSEDSLNVLKKVIYKRIMWMFLNDRRGHEIGSEIDIKDLLSIFEDLDDYFMTFSDKCIGKNVVIYGSGNEAKRIIEKIGAERVSLVIDRDGKKIDGDFYGAKFGTLNQVELSKDTLIIVSTMFLDEQEFDKNTKILGFSDENIYKMEDNILNIISIDRIWQGEMLWHKDEIFSMNRRISGWW